MKYTERDLLDRLLLRYGKINMGSARRYAVAEHVRSGDTYSGGQRVADFIAVDVNTTAIQANGRPTPWMDGRRKMTEEQVKDHQRLHQIHGHEVKTSRSDWLTELRDPGKAEMWKRYCHRWWLVAPADVVRVEELPEGWGLLVPTSSGLRAKVIAPRLDAEPMTPARIAMLMRATQTTGMRRLTSGSPATTVK